MPRALPEGEATTHARPVSQRHCKKVRADDFHGTLLLELADQIGRRLVGLAGRDGALLLAPSADAILMHNAIDAVLAHAQEHGEFAMPQGIIEFLPLLNRHRDLLIF